MFGIAVLLLLASAGIVGLTMVRRSSATTADQVPTAEPTSFVAIVETAVPTPDLATPTERVSPTAHTSATPATPQRTGTARATVTAAAAAALGSGQSKAARGVAGSMAITLGGTLPPAQVAAGPGQPTVPAIVPVPPTATPTRTRTPVPAGGGNTGGGNTGGGNTGGGNTGGGNTGGGTAPTATRTPTRFPTSTPTTVPTATATATPKPILPPVAFPGPGSKTHSYDLTYTQSANLASVPANGNAYILLWSNFTRSNVETYARNLGLSGAVQSTGDGFSVTDPAKGTLVVNNTLGLVRFTALGVASAPMMAAMVATPAPSAEPSPSPPVFVTVRPGGSTQPSPTPSPAAPTQTVPPTTEPTAVPTAVPTVAPTAGPSPSAAPSADPSPSPSPSAAPVTDAEALEIARNWLARAQLLPEGTDGGRVTRPTTGQILVTFHPSEMGPLLLGDPAVTVQLGTDGSVRSVNHRWPEEIQKSAVQLRGAQAAWADALAGKGYLEVDQTIPANLPPNTVFTGAATVTGVSVSWRLATADGTHYLVPLYVFEGTVALQNPAPGQDKPLPFRLYVQAMP
jgi:hypothetical protein